MFDSLERCAIYLDGTYSQLTPAVAKCFSLCRTTALAKNGPLALGKSDPREEHDLSQGKKKESARRDAPFSRSPVILPEPVCLSVCPEANWRQLPRAK
jgi:hypothetical protein